MSDVKADAKAIFLQALECQAPDEMHRLLDDVCNGDTALRARAEELLRAHREAGNFLGGSRPLDATLDAPPGEGPGTIIGPYKLLEQIGEGGMGLVFVAEQTRPVQRRVALKVIKPGMDTRQVIARFEAERQALALMEHAHIAKVFDGGMTPEGRPYFVMELVRGTPITDYCDQQRLTTRQRLGLFLEVCQAVQHAHQKGIIHRDLKPSNVLVSHHDVTPVVKVIDFGIAKATGGKLTEQTVYTAVTQMIGTPLYMSPEQAGLSDLDVDTRSDVYSLGVLLYELLTGTTPFESETLKQAGHEELRRIIREDEPPRPSARLSAMQHAHLSTIAEQRGLEPRRLSQQLRGELDWIVMKALEKDRERRYESASAVAADVQRYLSDEPVLACPPSTGYRLRKFARRHRARLAVAAVLGLVLLVVAGLGGGAGLWWAQKRAEAEGEARAALHEAAGLQEQGRWLEARSAAQRAAGVLASAEADTDLRRQAEELARDLDMVYRLEEAALQGAAVRDGRFDRHAAEEAYAEAFTWYGLDVQALDPQEAGARIRACAIRAQLAAHLDIWIAVRSHLQHRSTQHLVAVAHEADPDPWRNRIRDVLSGKDPDGLEEVIRAAHAQQLPDTTAALLGLEAVHTAAAPRAVDLLEGIRWRHPDDFWINEALGLCLLGQQPARAEEAVRYLMVAVALRPRSPGASLNLGVAFDEQGRPGEAVAAFQNAIALKPDYAEAHNDLGIALSAKGDLTGAIAAYQKAIALKPEDAEAYTNLGLALHDRGDLIGAIAAHQTAIALKPDLAGAHYNLGVTLKAKGDLAEAIAACQKALALKPDYAEAYSNLGNALHDKGDLIGAIAAHQKAIALKPDYAVAHCNLGCDLHRKGDLIGAIAAFQQAIALKPDLACAHYYLAVALRDKGDLAGAITACQKALALKPDYAEAQQMVHDCKRLVYLEGKLAVVVAGLGTPASPEERLGLAEVCLLKRLPRAATQFYEEAFAAEPALANTLDSHRYNAACAAALASRGQGQDTGKLNEGQRQRLRSRAFAWLRAELTQWDKQPNNSTAASRQEVQRVLLHWQRDPDLEGVRDPERLAQLPQAEQDAWRDLWAEVGKMLQRVQTEK
jgi:serine/threonine-protein kinase